MSALNLLGKAPQQPLLWATDIAKNASAWVPTFQPLLHLPAGIHKAAHKIAGIPAALLDSHQAKRYAPFTRWWFTFMASQVNQTLGLWCFQQRNMPPNTLCIGGTFAFLSAFVLERRATPWCVRTLDTVLPMQNKNTGLWSSNEVPGWIDLDALYSVTRCR